MKDHLKEGAESKDTTIPLTIFICFIESEFVFLCLMKFFYSSQFWVYSVTY